MEENNGFMIELKIKDERIVELTWKIISLKELEASNSFHAEKVRFLEVYMSDANKLIEKLMLSEVSLKN